MPKLNEARLVEYEIRPWGTFYNIDEGDLFKTKTIKVNPGCRLSRQRHTNREEHWIIISGEGIMELNGKEWRVMRGDTIFIDKMDIHRITNDDNEPLVFCEVQLGVCDEDDIERLDDDYGRI